VRRLIGVIGPSLPDEKTYRLAYRVGELIGLQGWITITGGLGGVMEAAACGARSSKGLTVGMLPGEDPHSCNSCIDIPIATGLGEMRNFLIVRSSEALISVGISPGTLIEMATAVRIGKPLIALGLEADLPIEVRRARSPEEALQFLMDLWRTEK